MPTRDRREWMNKATDPVLELLDEGLVLNGRAIRYTLFHRADSPADAPGRSTIYRALNDLSEHGFVEVFEKNDSYYKITDTGRRYLAGEKLES